MEQAGVVCLLLLLLLSLGCLPRGVFGDGNDENNVRIKSIEDFKNFVNEVNSGIKDYLGTTVLLDSDLSLSGETLEPIGKDSIYYFRGVFDGQGHIISDLKMNSSLQYTGLFGYSNGLTIRNVVLGSSCSITSSFSGSNDVYVGGIIGGYYANSEQCSIENSVSMADVSFSGSAPVLYLGGIAGELSSYSTSYLVYVKNCANYGSVTRSGASSSSYIGGIVGYLYGPSYKYLYNCLNYGTITHSGTTSSELHLGGIAGYSTYAHIENCVSVGEISSTKNTPSKSYIGSIVGDVASYTYVNYCYYTNDVGGYPINGTGEITNATGTPTSATTVDSSLVDNLNNHASGNGWNGWLLNKNNAPVTFKVNDYAGFTLNSQVILLPNIVSDWRSFTWFSDSSFATPFSSSPISKNTTLYGRWDKYTVTFDANGGSVSEISRNVTYNSKYDTPPEASRTGHMFVGWFTEKAGGSEVTSSTTFTSLFDATLHAHWLPQYTVTFDVNGGNELAENKTTVTFNKTYGTLPEASRTGYMFVGWFTESNESVTNETIVTTTANHTLHAHWLPQYTVTFDVNGGNKLTENKVTVTFNKTYGTLPSASRTGHMFVGWFTENNSLVTSETIVTTTTNHTLHAHWEEVTNQVEIVFNAKDLSKEDVEEIVRKYAGEGTEFIITGFGKDESGEVRVIITFKDAEKAEDFVRSVNELSKSDSNNLIKRLGFVSHVDTSLSVRSSLLLSSLYQHIILILPLL